MIFRVYRTLISPALATAFGVHCRFEESCSHYMERKIREEGALRGVISGIKRLLACNQWSFRNG